MSSIYKCDGCETVSPTASMPRDWLAAYITTLSGIRLSSGHFCTIDCLAHHLAPNGDKPARKTAVAK